MLTRRVILATPAALALAAAPALAAGGQGFPAFLAGVRTDARRAGVSAPTLDRALAGLHPNPRVLELDRAQPEFTQTWDHYRSTRLSDQRIAAGRAALDRNRPVLQAVQDRYGVAAGVIVGIWGLESNYGGFTGGFNVVEALATLAWDGRRAAFFRAELIAALKILDHGDVSFERMTGSYAGAMGQPQFMPSSFMRDAVDFTGDGRRDIWDNRADVLASIANYLTRSNWRAREEWGVQVRLPAGFDTAISGRDNRRPLSVWAEAGLRPLDGGALPQSGVACYLVLPGGPAGEAFLAYPNFDAIRRYNPSDFYALAVGLLGNLVTA